MAGKSSKGRKKKASHNAKNATNFVVSADGHSKDNMKPVEEQMVDSNRVTPSDELQATKPEVKESENATSEDQIKQGDVNLFPVTVKTQYGEKLVLQLSPINTAMDVRQFLLDAPETCFFTCYDLKMHTKDGPIHHLGDHCKISEVADITSGDCLLEMIAAPYDDKSIRAHVHRTRELLISLSTLQSSVSTFLPLQHEMGQNAPANSGDLKDTVDMELEKLVFIEGVSVPLLNLLPPPSKEIECVKSIVFSQFNPPNDRRLLGDLIYLDVVTMEGRKHRITGTTTIFYVNSSSGKKFNPRPTKAASEATTLIGLLQKISSSFKKAFCEMLERKASSAHPFESMQPLLPPNSWLGSGPVPENTLGLRSELIDMQRDWNEELQSSRELPHASPQERILRDRALYKVSSEFVDAARSGAIGVVDKRISPNNPDEPVCLQIYSHNNISFTFAVDADLEQFVEGEQFSYAMSNNDLNGIKLFQEAAVPGLYNLATAIVDYKGHRVVAQCIPKSDFEADSCLYGSPDNGKEIFWNQDFHTKVLEASKWLRMKEHTVLDGSGKAFQIAAPAEWLGVVGHDNRHYLFNLTRISPCDANSTWPNSKFCILRPELITTFCKNESEDKSKDIRFNPNVFTEFKLAGSPEEISADEESVRKVSSYLKNVVLPKFIQDLCTLKVSPMDGQTLTEELHAHGINVRYIGTVAYGTKDMPHLWDLCSNEIIVRSAKHLLKAILRDTADHDISQAVAHFLNCLFGDVQTASWKSVDNNNTPFKNQKDLFRHLANKGKSAKQHSRSKGGGSAKVRKHVPWFSLSSESLWSDILEFAEVKYQFELPKDARSHVKKISVVRNLCLKVGVAIAAKRYDLSAGTPFQTSDILNFQPVVKHSIPVCSEAKKLDEVVAVELKYLLVSSILGAPDAGYDLFTEAFTLLQQVTGSMHLDIAKCCGHLAMFLCHAGDMGAAIMQQRKELIINERCLGLDHPTTAYSYVKMARIYHELNQSEVALRHMSRALVLFSLSSGLEYPEVTAIYIEIANIYKDTGKVKTAIRYLQEALEKNKRLLGEEHIQTADCHEALSYAFACDGANAIAYQHEEERYGILVKQLGKDDSRTRASLMRMDDLLWDNLYVPEGAGIFKTLWG